MVLGKALFKVVQHPSLGKHIFRKGGENSGRENSRMRTLLLLQLLLCFLHYLALQGTFTRGQSLCTLSG